MTAIEAVRRSKIIPAQKHNRAPLCEAFWRAKESQTFNYSYFQMDRQATEFGARPAWGSLAARGKFNKPRIEAGLLDFLEPLLTGAYHPGMTFDFLLRVFRRLKNREKRSVASARDDAGEACETWDSENPFPDVVAIEFKDVLDLHSIPPRQVRAVVEDFIAEAHQREMRWVRIIHGKGVGVQREIVRSILARAAYVVEYKDAPAEAGGWGATIVTLGDL